jgi:hypothetical protein
MPDKKPMEREYGEMIYSLLTELNGMFMAQVRQVNNNIANVQRLMLDLKASIENLIISLKDTRDKRYQDEIDNMEARMETLRKELEQKKATKPATLSTSEEIRAVVTDMTLKQKLAEVEKNKINWPDVRNKVLLVVITAIVLWLLPRVGEIITLIFAPK